MEIRAHYASLLLRREVCLAEASAAENASAVYVNTTATRLDHLTLRGAPYTMTDDEPLCPTAPFAR